MLEMMTETSAYNTNRTLKSLGLYSALKDHFYYNARNVSNVINPTGVPELLYLDKNGNVTNISGFSISNINRIVGNIEGTVSE